MFSFLLFCILGNSSTRDVITWVSQRESPRLKMPFIIFIFFSLQSEIAVWTLKRMHACLIRGRVLTFNVLSIVSFRVWALFIVFPLWASFVKYLIITLACIPNSANIALLAGKCLFAQNWGRIFWRWKSGYL